MEKSAINELISYWERIYKSTDSIPSALQGLPSNIRDLFETNYFPQPFYGYFNEDMSKDILVPLINPGPIRKNEVTTLFPASTFEKSRALWNEHISWRHLTQPSKDWFEKREEVFEALLKPNWRGQRFKQCREIVGDIGFMHTIEYFPFHSPQFKVTNEIKKNWLDTLPSTTLSINVLEEIAINHLVKHIVGIGQPWVSVLSKYPDKFEQVGYDTLLGPKGKPAQWFFKFKSVNHPKSLPIVIYSTCAMNLPVPKTNPAGVKKLRDFLEIQ